MDTVQFVQVGDHVAHELVPEFEHLDAVADPGLVDLRTEIVVGTLTEHATAVGFIGLQHRRVPVSDDRFRLQHVHLFVDVLKLLMQPETQAYKLDFRDA